MKVFIIFCFFTFSSFAACPPTAEQIKYESNAAFDTYTCYDGFDTFELKFSKYKGLKIRDYRNGRVVDMTYDPKGNLKRIRVRNNSTDSTQQQCNFQGERVSARVLTEDQCNFFKSQYEKENSDNNHSCPNCVLSEDGRSIDGPNGVYELKDNVVDSTRRNFDEINNNIQERPAGTNFTIDE